MAEERDQKEMKAKDERRRWMGHVLALVVAVGVVLLIPIVHLLARADWGSNAMLAAYILSGTILAAEGAVLVLLKTARTRYSVERKILEHPEVNEYVILWNRPRWILYLPTLLSALLFGVVSLVMQIDAVPQLAEPSTLGGIWVVICVLNVLVEQFHMSVKTVLIVVPTVGAVLLVLNLVGYAGEAVRLLRYAAVNVPMKLYFITAAVIGVVIFVGWIHGLFHYMAITPNVADLQRGLTETGRQIKNADYEVDFDATDVVERWLFGFGRIIISFHDPSKPPLVFFVPHASVVDDRVRRVRSVTAVDRAAGDEPI